MPHLELHRKSRIVPASLVLKPYRRDVTSQCGEDGMIERIFQVIGASSKWCVEFGAWDGRHFSNTWNLVHNCGWSGLLIEGDPQRFAALQETCQDISERTRLFNGYVGLEAGTMLDEFLDRANAPRDFDFLSIDIDGNDWHVWRSLARYRPRVVVIEFNPSVENDISFVQDYDRTTNQGCSLLALVELGREKGYELVATTEWNAFFVTRELFPLLSIADNSIDALHEPELVIRIFQGYDGRIFATGELALYWHGLALTQEDFQVLPENLRRYPGERA